MTAVKTGTTNEQPRKAQSVFWKRFRKSSPGKVGAVIVLIWVIVALIGPILKPYDATTDRSFRDRQQPPSISALWNTELKEKLTDENGKVQYFKHPFGTDNLGRDVAVRVLHGSRISLQIGLAATVLAMLIGSFLGIISGFFGKTVDNVIGWFTDILLAFPGILLAIAVSAIRPPDISATAALYLTMVAVSVVQIPVYVRLARGVVIGVKEREFIQAAHALGAPTGQIIFKHVLPNSLTPLIVQGSLSIATATLEAAALGFLGLGAQPPFPEWGTMIADSRDLYQLAPWTMIFPGLAILTWVLGFNLLGDGLRDVLDPRSTH
ncbi:ABC transporter permease [Deinococcus cellulosilyticus]|uniref:Peptide ABC transporter permease n=1 Tax=Deinococcus cellulosilyticus (strain DSM 18568 / NBRC 106333 / KACC 11606 / 5516J-15) TaxID=1223518 RepID=A0A511N5K0_DEIC1|nr:ABC transporter permease [Deinococcus cellulosilyticus]GEM48142.1 peptide ABC transporter permease [Deinococcus cellulosilyticus NBRC 106333 = KACC 11606]